MEIIKCKEVYNGGTRVENYEYPAMLFHNLYDVDCPVEWDHIEIEHNGTTRTVKSPYIYSPIMGKFVLGECIKYVPNEFITEADHWNILGYHTMSDRLAGHVTGPMPS